MNGSSTAKTSIARSAFASPGRDEALAASGLSLRIDE